MPEQVGAEVPSHWLTYFAVDDTDTTLASARAGGATVLNGPMDMPSVGRFATVQDPQGAIFAVLRNADGSEGSAG